MKKKIFWIISVILVIAVVVIYIYNSRNQFKLDTDYKYIIYKKDKNPELREPPTELTSRYYEINLEKNLIEVRKDFTLRENEKYKDKYKRKLISSKHLTDEESKQLRLLLETVVKEDKSSTDYKRDSKNGFFVGNYYQVLNKNARDAVIWDNEVIDEFLEIVELEI